MNLLNIRHKSKLLSLFVGTILLATACNNLSTTDLKNKDDNLTNLSSIAVQENSFSNQEEINCSKESKFRTKAESTNNSDSPIKPEERGKGIESNETEQDPNSFQFFDAKKKIRNPYSIARPVPNTIRSGEVSIIFKDEYKIRLVDSVKGDLKQESKITDKETSLGLVSKNGDDIKDIEKLLSEYKVKYISTTVFDEKQSTSFEQISEKSCECDVPNSLSTFFIRVEDQNVKELIEKLRANLMVREVNYSDPIGSASAESEPIFNNSSSLSGIDAVSQDARYNYLKTNMLSAYTLIRKNNITPGNIAFIDVGFMNAHEDRALYPTTTSTPYVKCDPICNSYSNPSSIEYDSNVVDQEHGTWTSSIAAAPENNKGMAGFSHQSKVIPIKILTNGMDFSSSVTAAIQYVINNRAALNIKVINISLQLFPTGNPNTSQPVEFSSSIRTAINTAAEDGILVVMCAGNYNTQVYDDTNPYASISKGLVVGGVAKYTNNRWITPFTGSTSNYGKRIDISAPAEDIVVPSRDGINTYQKVSGTSFAAPQVAALGALLMGIPSRTDLGAPSEYSVNKVKSLIINSASLIQADKPLGSMTNANHIPNGRMLDVYKALDIATNTIANKSYIRLFNSDYYSEVTFNYVDQYTPTSLHTYYKEDRMIEIPSLTTRVDFGTYNLDCVYSWGYQIWKDSDVTFQRVKGIAGKRKPLKVDGAIAKDVKNAILTGAANSTDIDPTTPTNSQYYQGPNLTTTATSKW